MPAEDDGFESDTTSGQATLNDFNFENEDIEKLVSQATWRDFLMEVVNGNKIDPWNINVSIIADKYIQKVKEYKSMDLRLPANVILASALLLRFKSDALSLEEKQFDVFEEPIEEYVVTKIDEEIPVLVVRQNKPRTRPITLTELITAVEEVLNATSRGTQTTLVAAAPKQIELHVAKEDMGERIKRIYNLALTIRNDDGKLHFSQLLDPSELEKNKSEHMVSTLLPVLHLAQEMKLSIHQEEHFGDIELGIK